MVRLFKVEIRPCHPLVEPQFSYLYRGQKNQWESIEKVLRIGTGT